jgi:hypothetical protein
VQVYEESADVASPRAIVQKRRRAARKAGDPHAEGELQPALDMIAMVEEFVPISETPAVAFTAQLAPCDLVHDVSHGPDRASTRCQYTARGLNSQRQKMPLQPARSSPFEGMTIVRISDLSLQPVVWRLVPRAVRPRRVVYELRPDLVSSPGD